MALDLSIRENTRSDTRQEFLHSHVSNRSLTTSATPNLSVDKVLMRKAVLHTLKNFPTSSNPFGFMFLRNFLGIQCVQMIVAEESIGQKSDRHKQPDKQWKQNCDEASLNNPQHS